LVVNGLAKADWERKTTAIAANPKKTFFISVLLNLDGSCPPLRPDAAFENLALLKGPVESED
jgi:hypothetical protein